MRALLFIATLTLTGCASERAITNYCSIYTMANGRASPMGLVLLDHTLEQQLRAQLPPEMRDHYICWYTSRDRIIASRSKNPDVTIAGYPFIKVDGTWKLDNSEKFILQFPRVIQ